MPLWLGGLDWRLLVGGLVHVGWFGWGWRVRSICRIVGDIVVLWRVVCCVVALVGVGAVVVLLLILWLLWAMSLCVDISGWLPRVLVVWYYVPTLLCRLLVLECRVSLCMLWKSGVVACGLLLVCVCRLWLRSRRRFLWLGALVVFWARAKKRVEPS